MNITFTFLESLRSETFPERLLKCSCGDPNIIPKVYISGNSDVLILWHLHIYIHKFDLCCQHSQVKCSTLWTEQLYIYMYICGISTTNCHYTVFHGLNPIFRWLYDTIFICSKNKNSWKLTAVPKKFQTWILNTSNLICLNALFNQLSYNCRMKSLFY